MKNKGCENCGHADAGHLAGAGRAHNFHHQNMAEDFKKRFIISVILTLPILLLSFEVQEIFHFNFSFYLSEYVLFIFATLIFFYGGKPFLVGAIGELKNKNPGMMTLIGFAITIAYIYSSLIVFGLTGMTFFWELATLIDIMLIGHYIEMKQVQTATNNLQSLIRLLPAGAHKINSNGEISDIALKYVQVDDLLLVKPGERIPVDGVVTEGQSAVDESAVTGESLPIFKRKNSKVVAGSINTEGSLRILAKKIGKESFLSMVVELVKKTQATKSKRQNLADRAARWLTIIAITLGVMTFVVWLLLQAGVLFSLERMVTVMVITCPHALGLAVPLVAAMTTAISAKNGLLIKNKDSFEKARNINTVVFDKTGTLTKARFEVDKIFVLGNYQEDDLLALAYSLEIFSEHPLAQGINKEAQQRRLEPKNVDNFKIYSGVGIRGRIDGREYWAVGEAYLRDKNILIERELSESTRKSNSSVIYILLDKKIIGAILLKDKIREESKEAIRQIKSMGIDIILLTGDREQVAREVADDLGIDDFRAKILPAGKLSVIKEIQQQGRVVAMVGDGINDAPALAQADVGIAIGAGTDIAMETADVILIKNDPRDIIKVIKLARSSYRKMGENLFWASGYNVVMIPLAAGVLSGAGFILSPAVGAILMTLSTVIVAINARLLKIK